MNAPTCQTARPIWKCNSSNDAESHKEVLLGVDDTWPHLGGQNPNPKYGRKYGFWQKWSPICCCQSSTEVVRWIGNMVAANPMVKSVCPKIRSSPWWLISNFWREFAYISVRYKESGFKFGMLHSFDKSHREISHRGKMGVTVPS